MNVKELLVKDKKNMIICPSSYNEGIFKSLKDEYLYNLTFETPKNFVTEVLGSYLDNLVMKLEEGEDKDFGPLTSSGAKELINVAPFLDDKDFKDKHSSYFIKNEGYVECLKEMNILYTDYSLTIPAFHLALNELKKNGIDAKLLTSSNVNENLYVLENDNIIEEVENAVDLISDLIYNGKDINDIKVCCATEDYYSVFEDVLSYTDIPYQTERKISLIETNDGLGFYKYVNKVIKDARIELLNESDNIESIEDELPVIDVNFLLNYKQENPNMNLSIYNTLVSFFSGIEYSSLDYLKEFLTESQIKTDNYKNVLHITNNFNRFISENTVLFLCGVNQGLFPSTIRYNGLITDEIITKKNIPTAKKINEYNDTYIKNKLYSIKDVYISYANKGISKGLSPSPIIDKLANVKKINKDEIKGYSDRRDYLKYLKAKETYDLYLTKLSNLDKYHFLTSNNKNEEYFSDFTFDRKDIFKKMIQNKLKLSPTSIDSYVDCPFKYFFTNVYRLEQFSVQYANFLGEFFHDYMKEFIDKEYSDADRDLFFDKYKNKHKDSKFELSNTEKIFFDIFLDYLPIIHDKIKEYFSGNFEILREKELVKEIQKGEITIIVKGKADLIVTNKEDGTIYIFDYKTGDHPKLKLEEKKGLQMFIYMDAVISDKMYQKYTPFGMFYIEIKHKPSEINVNNDIKFVGYSVLGKEEIQSLFKNKNVTKHKEPIIGCVEDLKLRIEDVNNVVDEVKNDILNLKFKQKPSKDSCKYCKFNEFCYSKKVSSFGEEENEEESTDDSK